MRKCQTCEAQLNSYHPGKLCYPCQEKRQQELKNKQLDAPYYTLDDMCFILGYENPESVRRLGRRGEIPGRLPSGRHLYQKEQVDEWIRNRGKTLSDEKERHFGQLDRARTAIVDNYKKWVQNPVTNLNMGRLEGTPAFPIGDWLYGGSMYEITALGLGQFSDLLEVDKATAENLLAHLKSECPELATLGDFADLTDDKYSRGVMNMLQAHKERYKGNCPDCPR